MTIDNSIELAKIEGQIDVIRALYETKLITAEECESRTGNAVGQFSALYDAGAVDSKFNYVLALSISSAVDELSLKCYENRPDAEVWWTMRNEAKPGELLPDVEEVLAVSKKIQMMQNLTKYVKTRNYVSLWKAGTRVLMMMVTLPTMLKSSSR